MEYKYQIHYSNGMVIPANMPDGISSLKQWENYYSGVIFHDVEGQPYVVRAISRR